MSEVKALHDRAHIVGLAMHRLQNEENRGLNPRLQLQTSLQRDALNVFLKTERATRTLEQTERKLPVDPRECGGG